MLDIKADGQSISYSPLQQGKALILAGVKLAPGKHKLQLSFIGIKWANYLSLVGWLTLFMLLTSSLLCKKNKNHTNLDLTPSHDIFYRDL